MLPPLLWMALDRGHWTTTFAGDSPFSQILLPPVYKVSFFPYTPWYCLLGRRASGSRTSLSLKWFECPCIPQTHYTPTNQEQCFVSYLIGPVTLQGLYINFHSPSFSKQAVLIRSVFLSRCLSSNFRPKISIPVYRHTTIYHALFISRYLDWSHPLHAPFR